MSVILQGLSISVLGLGLTFAALGLFILVMVVLQRLFRLRPPASVEREPEALPAGSALARDTEAEAAERAAAIAVALSHLRSLEICQSGLGEALEAGRGPWWGGGQRADLSMSLGGRRWSGLQTDRRGQP